MSGDNVRDSYIKALRDSKTRRKAATASQRQLAYSQKSSREFHQAKGASVRSLESGGVDLVVRKQPESSSGTRQQKVDEFHENAGSKNCEKSFHNETQEQALELEDPEGATRNPAQSTSAFHARSTVATAAPKGVSRRPSINAAPGNTAMTAWREMVIGSLHAELAGECDNWGAEDDSDDDDSAAEAAAHRLPFYSPPLQRQKWGEDQILPHINWGDLFFDLFYVAAAYNMGALLISSMTPELWFHGVVYFIGVFGPLFNAWESKLVFDARYSVVDYVHRLVEVVRIFFVSFSVLHIKPIELMSDPRSAETFFFCLGLLLECLVRIGLKVELTRVGRGDEEAIRNHAKRKLVASYIPLAALYLVAVVISGVEYWNQDDPNNKGSSSSSSDYYGNSDDSSYGRKYGGDDGAAKDGADGYGDEGGDGHLRFLGPAAEAAAGSSAGSDLGNYSNRWSTADLPIALCAIAYLLNLTFTAVRKTLWLPSYEDFRAHNVPSNIDFCIHRYGEWTMLMLGEAVLSLLIVETTESWDYYFVALAGTVTVIMIQALHFESEPSHADHHALWRNMQAGVWYSIFLQLLSMALIAFGVSYKVMLKGIHKRDYGKGDDYGDGGGGGSKRFLIEQDTYIGGDDGTWGGGFFGLGRRYLAPSVSVTDQAAAALFCGSLTVTLVALELLTNTHRGMHENIRRLFHHHVEGLVLRLEIIFLTVFKFGLILFTATLSQWLNDPKWVAVTGFLVVACVAGTRVAGWTLVHGGKGKKKRGSRPKQVNEVPPSEA